MRNRVASAATTLACAAAALGLVVAGLSAQRGGGPPGRGGGGLGGKAPNLVASIWTAPSTVARTAMRSEWVDAPFEPSSLRLWIEYPAGTAPAPVVLVLQDEPGLDDWVRSAADQLALEGFIAVAPDLFSGFGPNGGNHDSFRTPDEALRVGGSRLTPDEAMRRALAAAAFAQGLPRANGAIGSIGFGTGGTLSFRLAAAAPSVDAAVVFYGAAPERAVLEQVTAPVVGFYGEEDEDVVRTLAPAEMTMGQLGKPFEVHRYPGATHFFLRNQIEGENMPATLDAWPRATAFLGEHLQITAGGQ